MSFQEFQKSPKRLTPYEIRSLIIVILGLCLLSGLLLVGNYFLARTLPVGGEFQLLRTASRSFLFDRIEPYSANVPSAVQMEVYGRLARTGEKPYILDIPFHLLPIFFPLALIPDETWARAFWLVVLEIGLVAFLVSSLRLVKEKVPLVLSIELVIFGCASFYAVQAFLEGSEVILFGLAFTGVLLALRARLDVLAGILLVVSAFHWQISAPFLLFIALSVYWAQRWRVYLGAAMALFILLVVSFLLYPGWVLPFMRASWNNLIFGFGLSTGMIIRSLSPRYGDIITWIFTSLIVIVVVYEWFASRGTDFDRVVWTACLTIAATPLVGSRFELVDLVVLSFPLMVVLIIARQRWRLFGMALMQVLLVTIVGIPWLVFGRIFSMPDDAIQTFLFLFLPLCLILGLYWIRWWMIRLPKTWTDQMATHP